MGMEIVLSRSIFTEESITVGVTSVGLTAATFAPANAIEARYALITVETDAIRWYASGTAADASGHLTNNGDVIELQGNENVRNFRAIRVTANATIRVSYGR